ncbi:MAG: 30S ribosomal protein S2 [Gammaproteobacteria bacterium]|nr:30S ribosomal protein S2 [Gammaproteobacteria bacterium]
MTVSVSMKQMLEAGVHFGHQKRFWNPKMAEFIFGEREKCHIINLEKTLPKFRELLETISHVTAKRGKVMFVGTKHAAREIIKEEAVRCGMPYVDNRWLGGMLTNYKTIRQSIKRLKDLEAMLLNPKALMGKTKKEVLTIQREKDKLSTNLEGIKNMGGLPDMLFIIDVKQEKTAILEAKRLGIAVAAIVDTNASPDLIDHMVPGNDDAIRAIRFYCKTIADVIIESRHTILEEEAAKEKEKAERAKTKAKPAEVKTAKKIKTGSESLASGSDAEAEVAAEAVKEKKPAAKKATTKK